MSEKNKESRQFRTLDLLGLLLGFALLTTLTGVILSQTFHDQRPVQARATAENFAMQLVARREAAMKNPTEHDRAPASTVLLPDTGMIGKDPWGQPFHYRVSFDASKNETRVYVWSIGPNHKSDSDAAVEEALDGAKAEHFRFHGDDLGSVKTSSLVNDPSA